MCKTGFPHDCMDAGGTSPWMGEGRAIMQEQLPSRLSILGQAPGHIHLPGILLAYLYC